jgi:hypothetical protein
MCFFFQPANEKNMKSTKTLQDIQQIIITCVVIKAKIKGPYLGWKPIVQGCELLSTPIP